MTLQGKVAVVTGSTSGIGLGIASALAEAGADVMLNGFGSAEQIAAARADLAAHGGRVEYSGADISRPEQAAALVRDAASALGSVDILVNNAGVQHVAPIESFPDEQWDRLIAVNLSGPFHTLKAAIPAMKRAGWGRVVNIASAHGLVGSEHKSAYVAAKHGLIGLTKVAAIELAGSGITVNAICPGWVLTSLVQQQLDERARREGREPAAVVHDFLAEKQPMVAFTTPGKIGAMAVFLCGEAASTVTGASLSIDGGWTAR